MARALTDSGLVVEHPAFGLDTAFVTTVGSEGPHVVVCCEYDALPEIGHGCGHNVIGALNVSSWRSICTRRAVPYSDEMSETSATS